ncbi:MAG: acyl carrier protein [Candidatus Acidiferrum sp.]
MALNAELRQFVIDNFLFGKPYEGFSDDDSFIEHGIIDSTAVMELIAFLEARYRIKLKDQELIPENLDSINGLARFVASRIQSNFRGACDAGRIVLGT